MYGRKVIVKDLKRHVNFVGYKRAAKGLATNIDAIKKSRCKAQLQIINGCPIEIVDIDMIVKKRGKPVRCIENRKEYESLSAAARDIGRNYNAICHAAKWGTKSGGYHWEFI